jgi:hypothetical protein
MPVAVAKTAQVTTVATASDPGMAPAASWMLLNSRSMTLARSMM